MKKETIRIFLGDLVHTWEKAGLWTFPINLGFIGSYLQNELKNEATIELQLFKRPELMIEAIRKEPPDIVGLSFYVWNTRLNQVVMKIAKDANKGVLNIGGGPHFTDLNIDRASAGHFFSIAPDCDAYVLNQGEAGFATAARKYISVKRNVERFCATQLDGFLVKHGDDIHVSRPLPALEDLNVIPSPYLNGMMDPFFDDTFTPLIETNRSCPYRCTFCAWGIGTGKLKTFHTERVKAEIDYIAQRCKKSAELIICDANFGILPRDVEIAEKLFEAHTRTGYPGHVTAQWSKAKPERVMDVAEALGGLSEVTASLQSINDDTLAAIKRRNLPLDVLQSLAKDLHQRTGLKLNIFSELILGLPEETRESHLKANRVLIDAGVESRNYNLHLLPGTDMDTPTAREKYFHRTGWRMHDGCYGIYGGVKVIEAQEVVLETSTMSMDDLKAFRFLHFLLQFMWGKRFFYDYLHLLANQGIHPLDSILAIDSSWRNDTGPIGDLFRRFNSDHNLEQFATSEDLFDYWSSDEAFERLKEGDYGKLNFQYTVEVLTNDYAPLLKLLEETGLRLLREHCDNLEDLDLIPEILKFSDSLRLKLTDDLTLVPEHSRSFSYDFLAWQMNNRQGLPKRTDSNPTSVRFYLDEAQQKYLRRQLDQYRAKNARMTLRTMSVYMNPSDLFYKVEAV